MTKTEKFEKAKTDHKYAIERIQEMEREIKKLKFTAESRLVALKKLDPATYGEPRKGYTDSYTQQRIALGG